MTGTDVLLVAASFVGAAVSGLAGFAFALVAAGVYMRVLEPAVSATLLVAGALAMQVVGIAAVRRDVNWPRLWPFLVGGVAGIPLGVELLRLVDHRSYRLIFGGFLVVYAAYMLLRPAPRPVGAGGAAADGAVGLVGGVMGGMSGFSGAVPTIWCSLRGWPKDEQRAVYQPFILIVQTFALAWLVYRGGADSAAVRVFLVCLPAMVAGWWLGMRLYRKVDEAQFRKIVLWLLLASGASLVV